MKFLKESYNEEVELYYYGLPINYQYNYYIDYWDGPQWDDKDIEIDWTYKVDKDSVKELLIDYVPDEVEEKDIDKYLEDHFDELFQKHEKEILDYYKDSAIEDAEENYEEEELDSYDPDYNIDLDEALSLKDNRSIKCSKLEEKLPKDLAKAYNRSGYYSKRSEHSGRSTVDYENASYEEISPEEAIKLGKEHGINHIRAIIDGYLVAYNIWGDQVASVTVDWDKRYIKKTGKEVTDTKYMPFKYIMQIADKIYYTTEDETEISDDKLKRRDRTDDYYFTGGADLDNYWSSSPYGDVVRATGAQDTGKHLKGYDKKGHNYNRYLDNAKEYKERLRKLQAQYDAGDISKNEYESTKNTLQGYYDSAMHAAYISKPDRNPNSPLEVAYIKRNLNKYKALKNTVKSALSKIENQEKKLKALKASGSNSSSYSYYRDEISKLKSQIESIQKEIEYYEKQISTSAVDKDIQEAEVELNRLSDKYSNAVAELNTLMKRN